MKALFEKVITDEGSSFLTRYVALPHFDAPLHYHPEYELTLIVKGSGQRFVGDHVSAFEEGDLVLLGSNLPHFWRSEHVSKNEDDLDEAVVIQFSPAFVDNILDSLPECKSIVSMLNMADSGIKFPVSMAPLVQKVFETEGVMRLLALIDALEQLSKCAEYQLLASEGFNIKPDETENERMRKILEFTLENFKEDISLETVAEIANLTVPSFCRYFKSRTRKTYIYFLNEIRLSNARKMLMDNELDISQISIECGFQNLSHFHRIFKSQTGVTPLVYRRQYEA
ncbi:AraC family transcriptional regulator [Emticicia sp. 21SJ11W-3]|uniref:AraC family transcriptional regulator n=1 Tax=Emticicia sp. 21SJ11W-3 TaxID=2916755 RepID=UPI00209FB9E5|nr:AraC family transcriptional regulator [Emticicia sp. 21SJ11W-3]UTA67458.1 AraC family transcriptional regulator [Emticicia sp. 21SJ11W-3]